MRIAFIVALVGGKSNEMVTQKQNAIEEVDMMSFGGIKAGELIEQLSKFDRNIPIVPGVGDAASWRGSYSELSLEPGDKQTVGEVLDTLIDAMGSVFTGYKGGEYRMDHDSEVYYADYGTTGQAIKGVSFVEGSGAVHLILAPWE